MKSLNESDVSIRWIRENKAEITLGGEGRSPEIVIFYAEASPHFVVKETDEE
ncbi:hypothetical protein [Oceanobacillus sojae]|uniref:Uncharacterized protein n=1 Tax=Oceanobacillus sojae TaxID=582851 RepID=A0A511ZEU8_9BACI|nr:hypothetical protein [Oceanobacillus sojae]GEN85975.1 hypothetical protein OSO01_07140 [Oceanobacillus sojae]